MTIKDSFDPDGMCPICSARFKGSACPHSFADAAAAWEKVIKANERRASGTRKTTGARKRSTSGESDQEFTERIAKEITNDVWSGVDVFLGGLADTVDGILDQKIVRKLRQAQTRAKANIRP